jgi:hypothetical protein
MQEVCGLQEAFETGSAGLADLSLQSSRTDSRNETVIDSFARKRRPPAEIVSHHRHRDAS